MVSLCVVGCGKERIHQFASLLQTELRSFVKQYKAHVYNVRKLWKAESSIELLKRSSPIILSTGKDIDLEYWGMLNVIDWKALYSKLFLDVDIVDSYYEKQIKYSASCLLSKVQFMLNSCKKKNNEFPYDFKILYHYEKISNTEGLCILEWTVDETADIFAPFEVFYDIISRLDVLFPDVFVSAYIRKTGGEISRFQYNNDLIGIKLLDVGNAFYICEKIKCINEINTSDELDLGIKDQLTNGTFYRLKVTDEQFDNCSINNMPIIKKSLIPRYKVINWSDLLEKEFLPLPIFDTISVYFDKYSPNDPVIVFSWGYTHQQLNVLPIIYDLPCQERYNERDFVY